MKAHLYVEGGGDSKENKIRCREGVRKLIEKMGFANIRMPRLSACGGRGAAFDDFRTAHAARKSGDYIAMLLDSEDPIVALEKTWGHLKVRDNWDRPYEAVDEQVLFMTTSMETWIVADRLALKDHYGSKLQESALPPLDELESRSRHEVHDTLVKASRDCSNVYCKGKRSFEVLARLDPAVLKKYLPSFARVDRILKQKL